MRPQDDPLFHEVMAANRRRNREQVGSQTTPWSDLSEVEDFEQEVRSLRTRAESNLHSTKELYWFWVIDNCDSILGNLRQMRMKEATK